MVGLLVPLLLPGAASAAPPVLHEHYRDVFSVPNDDDGPIECPDGQGGVVPFSEVGVFHGQDLVKPVLDGAGEAFLAHSNYWFRAEHVNLSNGRSFSVKGNGVFRELTGVALTEQEAAEYSTAFGPDGEVPIVGPLYRFTAVDVAHFKIWDGDGRMVHNERGRVLFSSVFDLRGDGAPGGYFVDEEEPVVLSGTNPFPDFCEKALELTT